MLDDARVALVDVAADVDTRIQLTDVFVDLPLASPPGRALATLCEGGETEPPVSSRWLLVGGPGSGKTTLTTMLAQVLRRRHVEASIITVPERERREAPRVYDAIEEAERALRLKVSPGLPLRIDLPSLAVWLASAGDGASVARFLAEQIRSSLGEEEGCDEAWVRRELLARRDLYWIFDGLDEVPASTNRDVVIRVVRDAVMGSHARLVVTTRPQSYAGEFDDLQPLQLAPIEAHVARQYALKLTEAWVGRGDRLTKRVEQFEREFARPELADLLRSPLHVAMAALLVARDGRLPPSRWALLDKYVVHIFDRELRKNIETGVTDADGPNLRVIHARAGLVLHVRSARATGTRPLLRPSELRRLIEAKLREDAPEDEALASVERLLRFADERLVLLLRESEHGYGFAVRSLQEFFAAKALLEDPVRAPERVRAVALDPHWLNVVLLLASRGLLAATDHEKDETLKLTAEVCEAIDAGLIRPEAAIPKLGARLARSMLCETEHATWTKLHDPLWKVVFRGVEGPLRYSLTEGSRSSLMFALSKARVSAVWDERASLQLRVGRTLARWSGKRAEPLRARARELAARLLEAGGELRQSGIDLLAGLLTHDDRAALDLMSGTPWSPDEASLLVSRLLDWENPGGVPVAARTLAKAMPAVFTPGHLLRSGVRLGYDSVDFDALSAAWRVRDAADKKLKVQIDETNFSVALHALTE
jgi:energy-coupling factor transporter ATP-binding protein EcfA2